jgi:hypothetical protein
MAQEIPSSYETGKEIPSLPFIKSHVLPRVCVGIPTNIPHIKNFISLSFRLTSKIPAPSVYVVMQCVRMESTVQAVWKLMDENCPAKLNSGAKGEKKYNSYSFLTSALDMVSGQPQKLFTAGEKVPDTHWIGVCVGLRAGLDTELVYGYSVEMRETEKLATTRKMWIF